MGNELQQPLDDFKPRELEILNFMARGLSNSEIADSLFITKETVRWYNKQIYSKLGTSRRTEAIALARQFGLINDPNRTGFNNVPIPTGTLWGRDTELERLKILITQPQTRLITLVAQGGMGKTRLAEELAHQISDIYADGIYFFDLSTIHDAKRLIPMMLDLFDLSANPKSPVQPILDFCRDKSLLLIFDNFETVIDAKTYLLDISRAAQAVQIIVTSREHLDIPAETLFQLQPLTQDAENLFVEMAQRRSSNFTVTDENTPFITDICNLVEGSPLGIILAAAWVDVLSVEEIVQEIQESIDFLADELTMLPRRQRNMRTIMEQTWKRLTEDEQYCLMQLSVFEGGFSRRIAETITTLNLMFLRELSGKSLIQRGNTGRFSMHSIIRAFANEKLAQYEPDHQTRQQHTRFYDDYTAENYEQLHTEKEVAARQNMLGELANIIAAIEFTLSSADYILASNFLIRMSWYYPDFSRYEQFVDYIETLLPHLDDKMIRIRLLKEYADTLMKVWKFAEAETIYRKALEIVQSYENRDKTIVEKHANLLYSISYIFFQARDYDETQAYLQEAIDLYQTIDIDNEEDVMLALGLMGNLKLETGDHDAAQAYLLRSLKIAESFGDTATVAHCHGNLGIFYDVTQAYEDAAASYQIFLDFFRQVNDTPSIMIAVNNLGWNAECRGDYVAAYDYYQEALQIVRRRGTPHPTSALAINMGFVAIQGNALDEAYQNFVEGIMIARNLDITEFILEALVGVATIAYRQEDYIYSLTLLEFIKNHDAMNHDIEYRLQNAPLDFDAVLSGDDIEAAHQQASTLNINAVIESLNLGVVA